MVLITPASEYTSNKAKLLLLEAIKVNLKCKTIESHSKIENQDALKITTKLCSFKKQVSWLVAGD